MNCCRVPKRYDAENEKNDYEEDEGYRKGKYKLQLNVEERFFILC